jgi:hypothetical protein
MAELLTKSWFSKHPLAKISAARLGYSLLSSPDFEEKAIDVMNKNGIMPHVDDKREQAIAKEEDLTELIRWMRRGVNGSAKLLLRKKLLDREQEAVPVLQKMLLTTAISSFIELSLDLFVHCRENNSDWLLKHYEEIRDPYARSTLCMLLGFRGDMGAVPFLMAQVELMEKQWPNKNYEQGPLLALYELQARFGKV